MGQTMVERIAQTHLMEGPARPLRAGDVVSLRPRHVLTHDNTARGDEEVRVDRCHGRGGRRSAGVRARSRYPEPVRGESRQVRANRRVRGRAGHPVLSRRNGNRAPDHGVARVRRTRCTRRGIGFPLQHVWGPRGARHAGGANGRRGDLGHRGILVADPPRRSKSAWKAQLPEGVTGKDVIITLCGLYNQGEVLNAAVEFHGSGVAGLTMDERFSIANMTTEWGALVGWFPVDDVTVTYLRQRREVLGQAGAFDRFSEAELEEWATDPPRPGSEARYAGCHRTGSCRASRRTCRDRTRCR